MYCAFQRGDFLILRPSKAKLINIYHSNEHSQEAVSKILLNMLLFWYHFFATNHACELQRQITGVLRKLQNCGHVPGRPPSIEIQGAGD